MKKEGLGTLAVLPREVRDKISSYVVASIRPGHSYYLASFFLRGLTRSIDRTPSRCWRDIVSQSTLRLSRQLRREFLETFLRDNEFMASVHYSHNIDSLLNYVFPLVDTAMHTRAVGVMIHYNLFNQNHRLHAHRLSYVADRSRRSSRCGDILRRWRDIHGIPSHRLFVAVVYEPIARPFYSLVPIPYRDSVENNYLGPTIRVYVHSNERSLAALDASCTEMLRFIQQKLDDNLHLLEELKKAPDTDNTFIGRLKRSGYATQYRLEIDYANKKAIEMVSNLRSFHEKIIEQMIQFWQDEVEFGKFCLGDFFALAEA